MDINHIKKVANSLSKLIDDNEKVALPIFAAKLAKASAAHPEDQTLGVMADITSRMANGKKLFISRAEIRDLYTRLYSRNSKFAELFSAELGQVEKVAAPTLHNREGNDEDLTILNRAYDKVVDPTLANALNTMFGNKTRAYSDAAAEDATAVCARECSSAKFAAKIAVSNGNADFIICRASFETPKGQTSVFVPIELSAGRALIPSIFIGNQGPEDFSRANLGKYITANAGQKLNVNDSVVFRAVESTKSGDIAKISSVDIALIKMNSEKETQSEYSSNGVYFQKVASEDKNLVVGTPTYKDDEISSFAAAFDSSTGVAKFKFGPDVVNRGRDVISNKLSGMGLKNHQISILNSDDAGIVYAVSLNSGKVAFKVPVKVVAGKVMPPTLLISNGALESFSQEGIKSLFTKESTDYAVAAVASPLYGLKVSELVQSVRAAMGEQNYTKAEDALNILSQSGDDKAYQTAFALFTNGLNITKVASTQAKCCMIVKNASSKHELCGHTGLPLHKVYQDKNGDCHPLYRRGMEDTKEGAYFLNSKIFF